YAVDLHHRSGLDLPTPEIDRAFLPAPHIDNLWIRGYRNLVDLRKNLHERTNRAVARYAVPVAFVAAAIGGAWASLPACSKPSCKVASDCDNFNRCCKGTCVDQYDSCFECRYDTDCKADEAC